MGEREGMGMEGECLSAICLSYLFACLGSCGVCAEGCYFGGSGFSLGVVKGRYLVTLGRMRKKRVTMWRW